ncbi:Uracil-DNA glycosylase [Cnuella takakiae]|uniref:Uracil-DNA glycosylase n=1 Tax=Cnuella takakiae TaxID=1302690 RepID=A0A1M4UQA1_9BACT|nr:uracil-DNA glycosylase [Cnuella takakiae]OLY92804.1 uracil-DNA glycosylase [Cnuella takakiae]SHE58859.1 Uracil-DNA glycosylase [Cnuella takakiae]
MDVKMEASWKALLEDEFKKPYFKQIVEHLKTERSQGKTIYPAGGNIFHAFDATPFGNVKVVILGQDPYHGPNQAHGLSFSVQPGVPPPPSLLNIYKELHEDVGIPIPRHGYLEKWANQGVLLLNASLTVRAGEANSHSKIGWEKFTDTVIQTISDKQDHVVFLLWGKFAQSKAALIDQKKHLILKSAHPSPLAAHSGFFGNHHFSQTNQYLMQHGKDPIDWAL